MRCEFAREMQNSAIWLPAEFLSNPPAIARNYLTHIQKLVGYTRRGTSQVGSFCDFQHPKDALALASPEGFEGQHRVDWARPERVASDWPGFAPGPDAALVGCEGVPERQQRHSGYGYLLRAISMPTCPHSF